MKVFLILAFLVATSGASAAKSSVFDEVTAAQPICYGREYSEVHLKAHPKQTVQKITAKLSKNPKYSMNLLAVEITLKGKKDFYRNYRALFYCENGNNCYIECDGGSADLSLKADGRLALKNNGFMISGGCTGDGGEEEGVFLPTLPGGDDIFNLTKLPVAFCQTGPDHFFNE